MTSRRLAILVGLGALALMLSYPPFPLPMVSFFAIVPAVLLVREAVLAGDARAAFRYGWWYGLVSNALVLYWMVVALWHFTPFSALGYLATIAIIGLLTAVMFWFVARLRLAVPGVPLWIVFPVAWTMLEWVIGHLGDIRFPWLGLGTSLADAPVLVQWADIAGARGVTLWLAWCNVAIVEAASDVRGAWFVARRYAIVLASVLLAAGYGLWRVKTLPVRDVGVVGLVQPNEGFSEKWNPAHADSAMQTLLTGSIGVMSSTPRPQLLIWPEAAVPGYFIDHPHWDAEIGALAKGQHVPILTGGLNAEPDEDGGRTRGYRIYNAVFFYDSTGDRTHSPIYAKRYLVPVTEKVPFVPVAFFRAIPGLAHWSGAFRPGRGAPIYTSPLGRFGVVICYESAFESAARGYRAHGADFLVNVTNDAWFGSTSAPAQHASHLVLRAIETRMGIARAANSGISELVDPLGRAYDATRLNVRATVIGVLRTSDVVPVYVRLGDWVGIMVVVLTLLGTAFLVRLRLRP